MVGSGGRFGANCLDGLMGQLENISKFQNLSKGMNVTDERIVEEYRGYKLVAALIDGAYKGKTWNPDGTKTAFEGNSLQDLITTQKDRVDKSFVDRANARSSSPEALDYVRAFQKILQDLPDSYVLMLKAHYKAPNRTITSTQLAEACKFHNYNAAVLHYGTLGSRLYEQLPIKLPVHKNGAPIYTFMLATGGDHDQDKSEWEWKMRPEVADAIAQLGLCD